MASALKLIFDIIIWVLVPAMLILAIGFINYMAGRNSNENHKASAKAGFWAGFLLFLIVFLYQVSLFIKNGFPDEPIFQGFRLWLALGSSVAAFSASMGSKKVIPSDLLGWTILFSTFVCFYALFHYLFIRTLNEILLSLILGVAFGLLAYIASSPTFMKEVVEFLRSKANIT